MERAQLARQRLLLDAVVTMAADLSLDSVLDRILTAARELTGARYAALGVLAEEQPAGPQMLGTFVHQGIDDERARAIGPLPRGHGLLGVITTRREPVRLHDIAAHPESYGFPAHHPPMASFLGVPVRLRDRVFGNLYLTERTGGDFTADDEEVVVALAAAAGVAIENARLYDEAARREAWLAAAAEVVGLVSGTRLDDEVLRAVARGALRASGAGRAWVATGAGAHSRVLRVVEPEAGEQYGELVDDRPAGVLGTVLVVPLAAGADGAPVEGVLGLAWEDEQRALTSPLDEALPARYASQVALAMQAARGHEDRERLAVLEDRDRIARDLHDLVIQRLFGVGLGLQGAARTPGAEPVAARLQQAVADLDATIADLRRSIFALGAEPASTDVQSEVSRMVDRAAATWKLRARLRVEGPVRTLVPDVVVPDLLAVLGEALANASRHARATGVEVLLAAGPAEVRLEVADDGRGLPADPVESGLANARARAARHGGVLELHSRAGQGTRLVWRVPRSPA